MRRAIFRCLHRGTLRELALQAGEQPVDRLAAVRAEEVDRDNLRQLGLLGALIALSLQPGSWRSGPGVEPLPEPLPPWLSAPSPPRGRPGTANRPLCAIP